MLRSKIRTKLVPYSGERQKNRVLGNGKWWRPERQSKAHIYHLIDVVLEENPKIPFAKLVDLAFACFFSEYDTKAKTAFMEDMHKFEIKFPWVNK